MGWRGGTRAVRALVACVAVLLPAAGWAATTLDSQEPTTVVAGDRAGATGLGGAAAFDEERAAAPPAGATVTVDPSTSVNGVVPSTSPATTTAAPTTKPSTRTSATTAPAPASTGNPTVTLPPGVPWPNLPPATGIPNIPPASSWWNETWGVTVRLRMEPPAPVAGQPVTFHLEYSSPEPCCTVMVSYGDGSGFSLNSTSTCAGLAPGPHSIRKTHTFAAAGSYKLSVDAIAALPCTQLVGPGPPNPPEIHGVQLTGCIGVGPGPVAQKGCSPFPDFGPDTLVSPIIDPFCQVRSDCTKASTPRPGWNA